MPALPPLLLLSELVFLTEAVPFSWPPDPRLSMLSWSASLTNTAFLAANYLELASDIFFVKCRAVRSLILLAMSCLFYSNNLSTSFVPS